MPGANQSLAEINEGGRNVDEDWGAGGGVEGVDHLVSTRWGKEGYGM